MSKSWIVNMIGDNVSSYNFNVVMKYIIMIIMFYKLLSTVDKVIYIFSQYP